MPKSHTSKLRSPKGAAPETSQQPVQLPDRILRIAVALLVVAALTAATIARNAVWQSEMALWEDAVRNSPNKGRAHHNLGRVYDRKGFFDEAYAQYQAAVKADPTLARAHESLGIAYVSRNRFDLARPELETALLLDPSLVQARMFLQYIGGQENRAAP